MTVTLSAPMLSTRMGGHLEGVMPVGTTRKSFLLASLVALLLLAVASLPAVARADWVSADAHIVDTYGTGYVNLLNVQVDAVARNDSTPVVSVQFSDDGQHWYEAPYDGCLSLGCFPGYRAPRPWMCASPGRTAA